MITGTAEGISGLDHRGGLKVVGVAVIVLGPLSRRFFFSGACLRKILEAMVHQLRRDLGLALLLGL